MHFNITNDKVKARVQAAHIRKQLLLERAFRRRVKALLDHQYAVIAEHARHGVFDVEHVVNAMRGQLIKAFSEHYTRVGSTFFDSVQASFFDSQGKGSAGAPERKGMAEEFWQAFHNWTMSEAAKKVKQVSDATKRMIRRTIYRLQDEGGSYKVIADGILAKAKDMNVKRALRIARTETHTASSYAVNESVRSTRVKFEREWVSMNDDRVRPAFSEKPTKKTPWDHRKANGQRRGMDEPFDVSGEKLNFPGDPKASAGNVINCRCVVLYHAVRGRDVQWL